MMLRALTGSIFVSVVIACILHSSYALASLLLVFGSLCLWEYFQWFSTMNKSFKLSAIFFGVVGLGLLLFIIQHGQFTPYWPFILFLFPLLAIKALFGKSGTFFKNIGRSLLGWFLIIPAMLSLSLLQKHGAHEGTYYVILFFASMWINDTGAYLSGRAFGKTPLFPRISPKKTWEGLIGGMVLAIAGAVVGSMVINHGNTPLLFDILFATIVALGGTFGDLVESAMKRELKIKDSGKMLPGHGGIMDRLDGVLLAAPCVLAYFLLFH